MRPARNREYLGTQAGRNFTLTLCSVAVDAQHEKQIEKRIISFLKSMTTANWIILTVAATLGGFIVGVGTYQGSTTGSSSFQQTLLMAIATIAAAFGGARAAYEFQWKRLDSDRSEERLRALNSVQLSISRASHILEQIATDILEPHRNNQHRFISMPNSLEHNVDMMRLNPKKIAFVLDKHHANFLLRLSIVELNIVAAITTINERSKIHRKKVLPVLEQNKDFDFENLQEDEIVKLLGVRTFGSIWSITDCCYETIEKAIAELKDSPKELAAVSKGLYPNAAIIAPIE